MTRVELYQFYKIGVGGERKARSWAEIRLGVIEGGERPKADPERYIAMRS